MAAASERETWEYRFRHGLRTHRAIISIIIFAAGLVITTLAIAAFTPLSNSWPFQQITAATDGSSNGGWNWNLVFAIVGPIVVIIGAYLVGAYYNARRKFEHLMRTKSKAEFLRNIPLLEELLWDLTPNDEVRYLKKREELRLPR
jgi:cytochrome bd-type quinol oxidase subunit 2